MLHLVLLTCSVVPEMMTMMLIYVLSMSVAVVVSCTSADMLKMKVFGFMFHWL